MQYNTTMFKAARQLCRKATVLIENLSGWRIAYNMEQSLY